MVGGGRCRVNGVTDPMLQLLVAHLYLTAQKCRVIIILPHHRDFAVWTDFLATLESESNRLDTAVLPSSIAWGADAFLNRDLPRQQRAHALAMLYRQPTGIILTTPKALAQNTLTLDEYRQNVMSWKVGAELVMEEATTLLEDLGYSAASSVEEIGRYAVRGGILDLFPPGQEYPVRVEFFGDEIESIRAFSVDTQRSLDLTTAELTVGPAAEVIIPREQRDVVAQRLYDRWIEQKLDPQDRDGMLRAFRRGYPFPAFDMYEPAMRSQSGSGIDYLRPNDILICPKSLYVGLNIYESAWTDMVAAYEEDRAKSRPVLPPTDHFIAPEVIVTALKDYRCADFGDPFDTPNVPQLNFKIPALPNLPKGQAINTFDHWAKLLASTQAVILCQSHEQIERTRHLLAHRDINLREFPTPLTNLVLKKVQPTSGEVLAGVGDLAGIGVMSPGGPLIIPEHLLFGRKVASRKPSSQRLKNYLSSFKELKVGGLVVHADHGIGRYCGLTSLQVAGNKGDYLILEYVGGDKVYLPVDKLNLLQRYNSGTDSNATAPLDRLASQQWQKRKGKVRKAVRDMADQLLKLQAKRVLAQGITFGSLADEYYQFESDFPYAETDDQLRAVADVNSDMSSSNPMDRLICGDVGFGKTEIAMRAAFRAVLDGYQVMVLVPTTVLCYQHFRTFSARMSKYGVRVAQANRFVKGIDLKLAAEGLAQGKVDILIGTHRLLSKDIKTSRLGLLIIDEEQRFGVSHKEKLKEFRAACDVLTLTATPIPRTLHMSMLGLRDISIIATPPQDRLAVKTYVAESDDVLIADAIMKEVSRGGQVFYLHNRVEDIKEKLGHLKKLCPDVDMRIGHGQMSEQKLEQVIVDFLDQKFSVLVCTTIIESGVDMPNVNTLIVDRSDRFGLAQLYQIRGRVGRSSRQAFAYFLTPPRRSVSEDAMRRLDILTTYQELGSGFHIASHDLEIRGAGNLLGAEQSGNVAEVGLELYTDMLDQAIKELRGAQVEERIEPEIKLPFGAVIPPTYIQDESLRLELYKRIFSVSDRGQLDGLVGETQDRYGHIPEQTQLLFKVSELKHLLRQCRAVQINATKIGSAELRFSALSEKQIDLLLGTIKNLPKIYSLAPDCKMQIFLNESLGEPIRSQINWTNELIGRLAPIALSFESLQ
jgi:transcription-repair coupling factor (superfamily II helicase)